MEKVKKAGFSFDGYLVQESRISRKPGEVGEFELEVSANGAIDKKRNVFQLDLVCKVTENNNFFETFVHFVGFYSYDEGQEEDVLGSYFFTNAPAILFPYVRSYIAALTALSGLPTINIPTLNLTNLGNELRENTTVIEDQPETD